MRSWTNTHYELTREDQPLVTAHSHTPTVSLHLAEYSGTARGFCLDFTRAHLAVARKLVAALEALPLLPSETEPFSEDDSCPTCFDPTYRPGFPCSACATELAAHADRP